MSNLLLLTSTSCFSQTLGNWIDVNSLNVARECNVAVLSRNTIIYTFGGYAYTNTPYPVESAIVQPDGSLSPWIEESSQMMDARCEAVGFATDSYIYAIGGENATSLLTTQERAPINSDGTLGVWTTIGTTTTIIGDASALIQYNQFIYVIGGFQGTPSNFSPGTNIYRTTINPDGTLGTWQLMTSQMNMARYQTQAALVDNYIYVNGGESWAATPDLRITERALINPYGSLGSWQLLTQTGEYHVAGMMARLQNKLYVIAGVQGDGAESFHTEYATVNPDYSLGIFYDGAPHPDDRQAFGHVQTSQGLYVLGGWDGGDMTSVQYAPLIPAGIAKREWEIFQ